MLRQGDVCHSVEGRRDAGCDREKRVSIGDTSLVN